VTVVDTSAVVDFLLGGGVAGEVERLMAEEGEVAAPDLIVFETLAVLRRATLRGTISERRAESALEDLGDLPVELFGSLPLRRRAWDLRANLTAADALFVALAEQLEEPLATKDRSLARAAKEHAGVASLLLAAEAG
jgi:predicted nucleic acid-binding protein